MTVVMLLAYQFITSNLLQDNVKHKISKRFAIQRCFLILIIKRLFKLFSAISEQ